jgi:hypothetical protein
VLGVDQLHVGEGILGTIAAPFVVAVGYETAGYRHVEADVRREG